MNDAVGLQIADSNRDQARAWDGTEGEFWATHVEQFDASTGDYNRGLFAAAAISPSDRVLDIGCGTGQTTREAARQAVAGSALGVDLSARMVAVAADLAAAEGVENARFLQADAQVHGFDPASFDVAISRTGAMFFGDPVAAFSNIASALEAGGRLALVVWQSLTANEWIREFATALAAGRDLPAPPAGAPGPFSLADPAAVDERLTSAGFVDVRCEAAHESMYFGRDVAAAETIVLGTAGWMLNGLDDADRERALADLRASLEAHQTPRGVAYGSAAWIVTARRG